MVRYGKCYNAAMVKKKTTPWFVKVRGSYLPSSWQGWLTYIPFVAYLVFVLVDVTRDDLSAKQAFYVAFPQFVCVGIIMTWVAARTSR